MFRVQGLECRGYALGFVVWSLELRVYGLRFRVLRFKVRRWSKCIGAHSRTGGLFPRFHAEMVNGGRG